MNRHLTHYHSRALFLLLLALSARLAADTTAKPAIPRVSSSVRALHEQLLTLDTHLDTPAVLSVVGWYVLDRHRVPP